MLTGGWEFSHQDAAVTVVGYLSRGVAFVALGLILGTFIDQRHRLEAELLRYFDESLDLLATADSVRASSRVSIPAWESALGFTPERAVLAAVPRSRPPRRSRGYRRPSPPRLAAGPRDTVKFRNRYLTSDGSYRWLEWNAHGSPRDKLIHAAARDISTQVEAEEQLANNARVLETKVAERTRELDAAHAETLQRLARRGRVSRRRDLPAHRTGREDRGGDRGVLALDNEQVELVREAAPLHDIGKLAIPDGILLKPGPLTPDERKIMQGHAEAGAGACSPAAPRRCCRWRP